jgi:hypothetical protein
MRPGSHAATRGFSRGSMADRISVTQALTAPSFVRQNRARRP